MMPRTHFGTEGCRFESCRVRSVLPHFRGMLVRDRQLNHCADCWLKVGRNEIVVFDIESSGRRRVRALAERIFDEVQETRPSLP